jgi:anti-anti-sigma regulatory factor
MDITIEMVTSDVPVTIMRLAGELDASNYQEVIARVQGLYGEGVRRLLLDLSDLRFVSSAGLVALHSAALIMRGQEPPDPEEGWDVFHAMGHEVEAQPDPNANLKIVHPQTRVARVLDVSGFSRQLEVYDERDSALSSFKIAPT